jgi:phage gp46-like protein
MAFEPQPSFAVPTIPYGAGTVERITEDGRRRVTEDGRDIRITELKPIVTIPVEPPITSLSDIRTTWDPWALHGDWLFIPPDLVTGRDLESAATISLFTDRLALPDDKLPDPNDGDRRGWWADWEADGGPIGSRIWLLSREKETEAVRQRAEDYCREALQWMLDDDVADAVEVIAAWNVQAPGRLDVDVVISRDRNVLLKRNYSWAWGQLFNAIR